MKFNKERFIALCEADLHRRMKAVLYEVEVLEVETTGTFMRILNTDRMLLYQAMGRVLNVSQCDVLQNRDEVSFLETLIHMFNYYIYDDGSLTIKWERFNSHDGKFVQCKRTDKSARPYLDYGNDDEDQALIKEIQWLLNWHEKHLQKKIVDYKESGIYDGSMDKPQYVDYFVTKL